MTSATSCKDRLEQYLRDQHVPFQCQHHALTYSAQKVAASEHISGEHLAKVVVVIADGRPVMLVLPASHLVQVDKLAWLLGTNEVRLAEEGDFASIFSDCDLGAMPPFGNLYGLPVYVDPALANAETIVFRAGTHTDTISMAYLDYARLVQPIVRELARHR
jgi:Ala-tRNA(Pro) deacylase